MSGFLVDIREILTSPNRKTVSGKWGICYLTHFREERFDLAILFTKNKPEF